MADHALRADARNRALRSFVQGLAIDVTVAVCVVLYSVTSSDEPIAWALVGASLLRTVVQSAASYVMRAFADASRLPTPLPPTPQPAPAEAADGTTVELGEDTMPHPSPYNAPHPHPHPSVPPEPRHRLE